MTDYNTLKVTELHAELHQRGVHFEKRHKKADLVKLLEDHDASNADSAAGTGTEPASIILATAVGNGSASSTPHVDPCAAPSASATALANPVSESPNASSLPVLHDSTAETVAAADVEIEKRKARAAKFGVPYVEVTAPAFKTAKTKPSAPLIGGTKPSARAVTSTVSAEDAEVLAKRRAKFGLPPAQSEGRTSAGGLAATTRAAPEARLIDPEAAERARIDDEKRKAREDRFKVQPGAESVGALKRQSSIPLDQAEPAEKKAKV